MGKKGKTRYKNPNQIQQNRGNFYYFHYRQYLTTLAYQLFEWKGLPESVDPRYLERSLHETGQVAFYYDKMMGYIVTQGTPSGEIDHYNNSRYYMANSVSYNKQFRLYNYADMKYPNMGVLIRNNDIQHPTTPSLDMFARDLAELKEIIRVNQNAQKTPFFIAANDNNLYSLKQIYNQIEGNADTVFVNEGFDMESLKVFSTPAPYVVDKMNMQKDSVWNEVMTFLSINNTNMMKKERMITSEADSNNDQISNSGNIYLKSRKEACERINDYFGLNISVDYREGVIDKFMNNLSGGGNNESLLHTVT